MNVSDFSKEFDLLYNNSANFSAPPVNVYMKSLYLTESQEEVYLEVYSHFESDEKAREQLRNMVETTSIDYDAALNGTLAALKFSSYSKLFEVPTDVWFILSEYINSDIVVKPIPIDEYNINIKNPFKYPKENYKAWRLDLGNTVTDTSIREIVYPAAISTYTIRYLRKPNPIILEDLSPYNVDIEGNTDPATSELSTELHRVILKRAVDKAILANKENNLQNRVAVGGRDN